MPRARVDEQREKARAKDTQGLCKESLNPVKNSDRKTENRIVKFLKEWAKLWSKFY